VAISSRDVIPLSQARANLSELADQVKEGAEKIITKNGESYVALMMLAAWTTITNSNGSASICCC
jgi:prevent-host-death family protein